MLNHKRVKNSVEVARLRHPKTLVFPESAAKEQRLHLARVQTITVAPVYKSMRIGAALLDAFCVSLPFILLGIFSDGFFYAPMLFACAAIIFGSALAPILFVPFILNLLDFMDDLHPLMHMAFWLLVIMVAFGTGYRLYGVLHPFRTLRISTLRRLESCGSNVPTQ